MSERAIALPFDVELLPVQKMTAGPLTCLYEAGNLRYICWHGVEIIRMIYSAVRDENWENAVMTIENESVHELTDRFQISYTAHYKRADIAYRAAIQIIAENEGTLTFTMQGEALSQFKTNRIGLCIHHPVKGFAGQPVRIERNDKTTYETIFPLTINQHQLFLDMQAMETTMDNSIHLHMCFEGDIFETEDQRNWTDSGYKTYGTPLSIPYPSEVKAGSRMAQKISVTVKGKPEDKNSQPVFRKEKIPFPKIGYECSSTILSDVQVQLLHQIPFDHYRVELRLSNSNWKNILDERIAEAKRLHTKLELIVFFPAEQIDDFIAAIALVHESIACILVLQEDIKVSPPALLNKLYDSIKKQYPFIQIGYGTDAYFTEINRGQPQQGRYDFLSYPFNPQVHFKDTRTMIENLERQADTIATARQFTAAPIHISPVTLMKRGNPDATATGVQFATYANPRQHSYFAAGWTLLCLQNIAPAARITFYQVTGDAGLLKGDQPSPVYKVLKQLKDFNARYIVVHYKDEQILTDTFTVENDQGERLFFTIPFSTSYIAAEKNA